MKLFKNGVGRPTNEIKKKRKLFILVIVTMIFVLVSALFFLIIKGNANLLNAAANDSKTLELNCPTSVAINQQFSCTTNIPGTTIKGSYPLQLAKGYKIEKVTSENDLTATFKYTKENNFLYVMAIKKGYATITKKIKIKDELVLLCPTDVLMHREFKCVTNIPGAIIRGSYENQLAKGYKIKNITTANNLTATFKYTKENKAVYIAAEKKGYTTVKKKINVENLKLSCPTSVLINEEFKCTTNIPGASIRGSYEKQLAKGYKIKNTTTASNLTTSFKYTKKNNAVYIAAEKKGYTTIKKKIKIEDKLNLVCPTSVAPNVYFKCKTNVPGITLRGSYEKQLAKGHPIKTITGNDLTATFKYTKENNAVYIAAEKKGYATVKKKVKVENLVLQCPGSSMVNKEFVCVTNLPGVKITVESANSLANGFTSSFTTSDGDLAKNVKYSNKLFDNVKSSKDSNGEYVNVKVTASKGEYNKVELIVSIYKAKTDKLSEKCMLSNSTISGVMGYNKDADLEASAKADFKSTQKIYEKYQSKYCN